MTTSTSKPKLIGSDAVAALICLDDGRYVMQLRDDIPQIWYPNHWGCFGGAVNPGEDPDAALRRELQEELEFDVREASVFTRFEFDLGPAGGRLYRIYYRVAMTQAEFARVVLHEGADVQALPADKLLNELRVTPYDAFALFLHHDRARIAAS
jgi:8-oxo-dGTP pyrophosphatase MutT (NUDIX family)